jgi:hypothetical protein
MRIRKPRNFSFIQLAVVSAVGVFGGAYIYQPLILQFISGKDPGQKQEIQEIAKGEGKFCCAT